LGATIMPAIGKATYAAIKKYRQRAISSVA
jgi:hypothetical protein